MQPRLSIIAASIRRILTSGFVEPTSDPYLDNVVLSLRMESSDPYYNQVVLGMHMDDTGLTDVKGHTITLNGNASRSATQSKFGGYSAYFDGTGDYLTLTTGSEFNFGTDDFTIECWLYPTTIGTTAKYFLGKVVTWATNFDFSACIETTGLVTFYAGDNTPIALVSNTALSINNWYHLAFVRNSGVTSMYINGIKQSSTHTGSVTIPNDATTLYIGSYTNAGSEMYYGYIDDLRITKGVARYTKSFSVPTAAFSEPANTAIDDTGKTVTTVGGAQFSGLSKYGSGSFYFDGTGDYLTVPDTVDFDFGTSDFTIETWINSSTIAAGYGGIFAISLSGNSFGVYRKADKIVVYYTSADRITSSVSIASGSWYHVAAVLKSGTITLFINGVSSGQVACSLTLNASDTPKIGTNSGATGDYFNGYIDDLRITKGVARYTSNFTPYKILTTAPAGDPLYNYTTLLLKMNGTNGGTTFTDNSYSPKTMTVVGNTNTSTAQLKYGTASAYFDGTGDYLTSPNSTDFNFGSGDFTVECWVRTESLTIPQYFIHRGNSTGYDAWAISIGTDGKVSSVGSVTGSSYAWSITGTKVLSVSTWYHVALVRSGTTIYLFVDGILDASATDVSGSLYAPTVTLKIGCDSSGSVYEFTGYIDEVRLTKGFARYTATFQPPGPHIAAIDPDTDQWWLNTVLALRMDGSHGSTTFTDLTGKTVTANGNASISSAVSKFGQAGYFDGTGDYLSVTGPSFGTGDFCVECWVYPTVNNNTLILFDTRTADNDSTGFAFYLRSTGKLAYIYGNGVVVEGTTTYSANTWHHVAVTRISGTVKLYLNGVQEASFAQANSYSNTAWKIGHQWSVSGALTPGYIDDFRVTQGVGRYTAAFTPSEKPLPTYLVGPNHDQYWDKVVLACPFDTSLNDTRTKVATAYGNAAVSTSQKMFGAGSANFDGTGDYITYPDSTDWDFTTSFTIEFWCYITAFDTNGTLFVMQQSGATYGGFEFYADQYGTLYFRRSNTLLVVTSATGILTAGSWKHLAATWDGTTYRVFVDGIIVGSGSSASAPANVTGVLRIGTYVGASTYDLNGYIDDLRITKDVARYTANFEPPTKANILG